MSDWLDIWRILQVVLGIGLIIFVHEAGHFVAARLCKVRVDVFSLGFGPRLFGWRRGSTLYQVAAVPLGGYVKMAGDDPWPDDPVPAPDALGAKTVGQRFFIFSGGVLANVLFGLVVFPILFSIGVPFNEPIIGPPEAGSPAWHAGLEANTRVLAVNGKDVYAFMHIPNDVALGPAERCTLRIVEPGASEPRTVELAPRYSERAGMYTIGVYPAADPEGRIEVVPGGPAERAGLRDGDRLLSVEGGIEGLPVWDQLREVVEDGRPLAGRFARDGQEIAALIEPVPAEKAAYTRIGVHAPFNHLFDIRRTPRTEGIDLRPGDRILSVGGRSILRENDLLAALVHPEGLGYLEGLDYPEGLVGAGGSSRRSFRAIVEREGETMRVALPALAPREAVALVGDLALEVDQASTVLVVSPGEPAAEAGLQDGDRVLAIDGQEVASYEEITKHSRAAGEAGRAMRFTVRRDAAGGEQALTFEAEVEPRPWHPLTYGLEQRLAIYVFRVEDPLKAVEVGMVSCWKFLQDTWLTLKGMVVSRVSPKNVGGPIAIGVYAHDWASAGWTRFFFFLCMLSINLAFINVLPIPLLDGGHLLFLLIEKIKGSPVSYRVMSYSQVVGLVLIVTLFVFVIYNDVQHHILG